MKKSIIILSFLSASIILLQGCKKDNYPGGRVSPYISLFDVRSIYKGSDVTLTLENMFGAGSITGVVISDHTGGNLPTGWLMVQDSRRLGRLRGITIPLGAAAADYMPGDSVVIEVTGGVLKKADGVLQLTGINTGNIRKVSSGNTVEPVIIKASDLLNSPDAYESTLISIAKAGFDPSLPENSTYAGDRLINDGFGNVTLHTEAGADYADDKLPFLANFSGVVINSNNTPQLWPRSRADIMILSATAPKIAAIVITGYLVDPTGTDANHEYVQLMATRDIDFEETPYAMVTTNNAGTAQPTGFPPNGWATGGGRTYKFNLTTGSVQKGEYFYVGGINKIWGGSSDNVTSSQWFTKLYASEAGDGFGTSTTNLLANSGNAAGIALFDRTDVDEESVPIDVIFYGGGGSVFTAGPPPRGYRITNTDYYDVQNPSTLEEQPFYAQGSNTTRLGFPPATNFSQLGGTYNISSGRWSKARSLQPLVLTNTSTVIEIEGATLIEE
jgi:hypothetical protein